MRRFVIVVASALFLVAGCASSSTSAEPSTDQVPVPAVLDLSGSEAVEQVRAAGLNPRWADSAYPESKLAATVVIALRPVAGTLLEPGADVFLNVAAKAQAATPPPAARSGHTVKYTFSGGANVVAGQISYSTKSGGISQEMDVTLPWSKTVEFADGTVIAAANAQNSAGGGTIRCAISIDGVVVDENESTGEYAVVQCVGTK